MQFIQNTFDLFRQTAPEELGSMNMLISGTIDPLSVGADFSVSPPTWVTGSWNWEGVSVGRLDDAVVKGITVTNFDLNRTNNIDLFRSCTELSFTFTSNASSIDLTVPIIDKRYYSEYTFFNVDVPIGKLGVEVYFYRDTLDNFLGYSCKTSNGEPVLIGVYPVVNIYSTTELAEVNPLLNNALESRLNSVARNVDYVKNTGLQTKHSPLFLPILTTTASIENSFYTDYGIVSARYLGSKNSLVKHFTSSKIQYSLDNLNKAHDNSLETVTTTLVSESLVSQSISGSFLSGSSIQFVNKVYTGSVGVISTDKVESPFMLNAGVSMSFQCVSTELLLSDENVIGITGVNPFGKVTKTSVAGVISRTSYLNMYVSGTLSGSVSGTLMGQFDGRLNDTPYSGSSINSDGTTLSGSFEGFIQSYFIGDIDVRNCSGSISANSFTGSIVGHADGKLLAPVSLRFELYSISGSIEGPLNISPDTTRTNYVTQNLSPILYTVQQISESILSIPFEMPFYNTYAINDCFVIPDTAEVQYLEDVSRLQNDGTGSVEDLTLMVGVQYVSQSNGGGYLETVKGKETVAGLRSPAIGDILYKNGTRILPCYVFVPTSKNLLTIGRNGQVSEIKHLLSTQNIMVVTTGSINDIIGVEVPIQTGSQPI